MKKVSVVKCQDYKYKNIKQGVEDAIDLLGGIGKFVPKDAKVLIKPNLLLAKEKEHAVTTDPEVLRHVIRQVKKQTKNIIVGESPGYGSFEKITEKTGIREVCANEKVQLMDITFSRKIKNPKAKLVKVMNICKEVFDADVIINLPKMKTHMLTVMTCAVKNFFGFIPGLEKPKMHLKMPSPEQFSEMLIDLNLAIKPTLTIVDGVVGMEGEGPGSGDPKNFGVVVAGSDNFSVDAVCASIMGIYDKVPTVKLAIQRGIKEADINNVEIIGEKLTDVTVKEKIALPHDGMVRNVSKRFFKAGKGLFIAKPVLVKERCIKCKSCETVCPTDPKSVVLNPEINDGFPKWNYKSCIRCYTCAEYCTEKAITIKGGIFSKKKKK